MPILAFQIDPPIKVRAGFNGTGDAQTPFFFDCAACGAKEPLIAGVHASGGEEGGQLDFRNIAILTDGPRGPRHALYCAACFARILSQPDAVAPGTQQQQTTDTSVIIPMDKNTAAGAPAPKTNRTALFTKEKDTKNTVKFNEVAVEGQAPVCGTLYLQKWFCGAATNVRVEIAVS